MYANIEQETQTLNESEDSERPSLQNAQIEFEEAMLLEQFIRLSFEDYNKQNFLRQKGLAEKYYKMLKNMKMSKSSQKCSVCLDHFKADQIIKRLPCKHIFHRHCAKKWLKVNKTCPICRSDIQKQLQSLQKLQKIQSLPY